MHYFGTMFWLMNQSIGLRLIAAIILLSISWWVPVLAALIVPGFAILLSFEGQSRFSFWRYYLVFAAWNGLTSYWIANAHPLGVIATVGINGALMGGAFWFGQRLKEVLLRFPSPRGSALFPYLPLMATWISLEKLHEHWGLSFPWLHLGNTFHSIPQMVQWYSWTGVSGGTLWVLVLAALIHYSWKNKSQKSVKWFLGIFTLPFVVSQMMWYWPEDFTENAKVSVAVVQPNINAYTEKWEMPEGEQIEKVRGLLHAHLGDERVDLIVLPETFLPKARQESTYGYSPMDRKLHQVLDIYGDAAIFGATTYDFQDAPNAYNRPMGNRYYTLYNTALFRTQGMPNAALYHKGKLVVGGETMPFVQLLKPWLGDWALELGGTSGTLGVSGERTVFDNGKGMKLGPIICWENEFSDYTTDYTKQGANLLAVITNDGWWGDTQGHVQHMRFSGLRAIENGKWIVRSANTGISCVIDQKGRVHEPLGWEEEGVIVMEVPLLEGQTIYSRTGDSIGQFMIWLFALNLGVLLFSRFFRLKPR
jgi:apolipoprotein N-acyltransferase